MKINSVKRLYHGTNQEFEKFDFGKARSFKDFGKGFYLTSNLSQAQRWAQQKARLGNKAYIYSYSIEKSLVNSLNVLELLEYDKAWVDLITKCRMKKFEPDYDIVYDRMADKTDLSQKQKLILKVKNQNKLNVERIKNADKFKG